MYCGSGIREFAISQMNYILGENPMSGFQWMSSSEPTPNISMGAMVGGPDQFDKFQYERSNSSYTEPTLAGNAGLVAALVSLIPGNGIDSNL
uniref:cellulase n=1 Tax=Tanacetum cinerariifolium TaxID=118510 RepID=A0A6L2NYD7_TANCI|nr:endoglucanase 12-like [Tanacetum cinerariifolium]